jgi:DNA (cytosine-5)-methyltransferase 1
MQSGRENRVCEFGTTSNSDKLNGNNSGFSTSEISQLEKTGIFKDVTNTEPCRRENWLYGDEQRGKTTECRNSYPQPNWTNFPTQPPVCNGNDGIQSGLVRYIRESSSGLLTEKEINQIVSKTISKVRTESIKAGGNAVVPQIVFELFKAIEQFENKKSPNNNE